MIKFRKRPFSEAETTETQEKPKKKKQRLESVEVVETVEITPIEPENVNNAVTSPEVVETEGSPTGVAHVNTDTPAEPVAWLTSLSDVASPEIKTVESADPPTVLTEPENVNVTSEGVEPVEDAATPTEPETVKVHDVVQKILDSWGL